MVSRIESTSKEEGSRAAAAIRKLRADLAADVQRLPMDERVAPRSSSEAQFDLSQAKLFLRDKAKRDSLLHIVTESLNPCTVPYRGRLVHRQVPVAVMLNALTEAWRVWTLPTLATTADIAAYEKAMCQFGEAWSACQWDDTVWVHWMVCHSSAYLSMHKSLRVFSSIPTEYKHKHFKLDVSHCCMAWKMTRPAYTQRSLAHVIRMHALDLALSEESLVKGLKKHA